MSTPQVIRRPMTRRDIWKVLRTTILSPAFIAYVAIACLFKISISGQVYFLLRSCLSAPSGGWIITTIVLGVVGFVGSIAFMFRQTRRAARSRRAGTPYRVSMWFLPVMGLSINLGLASSIALFLWQGMHEPDGHYVNHKLTLMTPREQLISNLHRMQRNGIWTWTDRK